MITLNTTKGRSKVQIQARHMATQSQGGLPGDVQPTSAAGLCISPYPISHCSAMARMGRKVFNKKKGSLASSGDETVRHERRHRGGGTGGTLPPSQKAEGGRPPQKARFLQIFVKN